MFSLSRIADPPPPPPPPRAKKLTVLRVWSGLCCGGSKFSPLLLDKVPHGGSGTDANAGHQTQVRATEKLFLSFALSPCIPPSLFSLSLPRYPSLSFSLSLPRYPSLSFSLSLSLFLSLPRVSLPLSFSPSLVIPPSLSPSLSLPLSLSLPPSLSPSVRMTGSGRGVTRRKRRQQLG